MKMLKKTNKMLCLLFASSIIATSVPTQNLQAQEVKASETSAHMSEATREKYMAGNPVPIKDLFPDQVLAEAVRNVLGKEYDNPNATAIRAEIEEVTSFGVEGGLSGPYEGPTKGLRSLEGLELFTNVTYLYLVQGYVKDISPIMELKQLEGLTMYYVYGVDLSPFASASLPNLQYLNMGDIQGVTDVSPLQNANLPKLEHASISMTDMERPVVRHGAEMRLPNMFKGLDGSYIKPEHDDYFDFDYENDHFVLSAKSYDDWDNDGRMYYKRISVREEVPFGAATLGIELSKYIDVTDGGYPVKFINNGDEHEVDYYNPLTVAAGSLITEPGAATWNSWDTRYKDSEFLGWYTADGRKWDFAVDTMPAAPLTLYAQYHIVAKYWVLFDAYDEGVREDRWLEAGELIKKPADPVKEGYYFIGWYQDDEGGEPWDFENNRVPEKDLFFNARFKKMNTVSYYVDGEIVSEVESAQGSLITKPADPVKPGYQFTGWYPQEKGGNKWVFKRNEMPENDLQLYARFEKNKTYTVAFLADGVVKEVQLTPGQLIAKPADPVKEGYRFVGWYQEGRGGNKWVFKRDKAPESNLRLHALFVEKETYTVSYNVDGVVSQVAMTPGQVIEKPVDPKKPGQTFTGWYTQEKGGKKWVFKRDQAPEANLRLYARFR